MIKLDFLSTDKYPSLTDVVDYWAEEKANKVCLREAGGKLYTYAQLKKEVDSLAAGLYELGVTKGSTVLTMLENSLECVETWLAINKLGAIDVPVHTAYKGFFISHIVNTCEAKFIFANRQHLPAVIDSLKGNSQIKLILVGEEPVEIKNVPLNIEVIFFKDLKNSSQTVPMINKSPDDIAHVLFTSGTKNGTKGLILTYQKLRNQMISVAKNMELTEDDISYVCFPMSHGNGKFGNVGTLLLLGGTAVIVPKFSASRWIHDIAHYQITFTSLMGPMAEIVYKQPPTEFDHDNQLRVIMNIPRSLEFTPNFEKRFGVICIEVYGQVGITAPITTPIGKHKNYASCGQLKEDLWDARLINQVTGSDVLLGETGELWLRPKQEGLVATGYYNDSESFQLAWNGEWFMTGDLMCQDRDGNYYYKGRTGDFIRRRGENISTQEVEMVIRQSGSVKDAAVFGVPTEFVTGEEDVMVVVEADEIALEDLINYCKKELPAFAVPRYWLVETLPRLPDRTIDKQLLQKRGVTAETKNISK
jgi:crotonobetaine/carnitine-CoA ligase